MLLFFLVSNAIVVSSYDSNLSDKELNQVDENNVNPEYYSIVVKDVLDVMNELDNNAKYPFGEFFHDRKNDENIEELLTEYQHYLDKAHKQKKKYLSRKNLFDFNPAQNPLSLPSNTMDVIIPIKSNINEVETSTLQPKVQIKLSTFDETFTKSSERNIFDNEDRFLTFKKPQEFSSDCCNEHATSLRKVYNNNHNPKLYIVGNENTLLDKYISFIDKPLEYFKPKNHILENILSNMKINMKIDIQLPMAKDTFSEASKDCIAHKFQEDDINQSVMYLPFPFLNFPTQFKLPSKINKINKNAKYNSAHKNKKAKSNAHRKHHKKGIVPVEHFNELKEIAIPLIVNKQYNEYSKDNYDNVNVEHIMNNVTEKILSSNDNVTNIDNTSTAQEMFLTFNVTFNTENQTNTLLNTNRNFEETTETNELKKEVIPLSINSRKKRQTHLIKKQINTTFNTQKSGQHLSQLKDSLDKNIINDEDLLYWTDGPSSSVVNIKNKTITNDDINLILNIGDQVLQNNLTLINNILDQINWNNVNRVATLFTMIFGKHFNGILTFCSDEMCETVKCYDKICLQRSCLPKSRRNQKGHCNNVNSTENVILREFTINMSKLIQPVLNIAQNQLLGKIFGKGTFCINLKCKTIILSKKLFLEADCTTKTLNPAGHCSFVKL